MRNYVAVYRQFWSLVTTVILINLLFRYELVNVNITQDLSKQKGLDLENTTAALT